MRAFAIAALITFGAVANSAAPTVDQVERAFDHYSSALRKALHMPASKDKPSGSKRLATRSDVLTMMVETLEEFKGEFKFTPRPPLTDELLSRRHNDSGDAKRVAILARYGCIAPVGPLVTGPERLQPAEYGRAIGLFFSRLAQLTHMPNQKYTPFMKRPGG